MPEFIQLHTHTCFSLLSGVLTPDRLVALAADDGASVLAITDQSSLGGAVQFSRACKKVGIRPIFGLEVPLELSHSAAAAPVALLAMNEQGWANLCLLLSQLLDDPSHDSATPCSLDQLRTVSSGLLLLTGGRRSHLYQMAQQGHDTAALDWLANLKSIFPDRLYIELQVHTSADAALLPILAEYSARSDLPMVASHDIFYETQADESVHQTLTAIRLAKTVHHLSPSETTPYGDFRPASAMQAIFDPFPSAQENTRLIAQRCQFDLPLGVAHFPRIDLPADATPTSALRHSAFAGAKAIYGSIDEQITAKLEYELTVIEQLGFEPIFLIMEEVIRYARSAGVPVSSRGSAASSLVAHCLGITAPDPIALNLYFERFLNPARATPPDIDTDLCSRRRVLVIQHVVETYGQDRVAMVGTINRFRPRSALGEVAKAFGLSASEAHRLTAQLPYYYFWEANQSEDETHPPASPFQTLIDADPAGKYTALIAMAQAILGLPRHLSVHPGGVVITPGRLTDLLPVQRASKGIRITQFDHKDLEPLGVVKLDLLGIRGLTVLGDVSTAVHSWQQRDFATPLDVLQQVPQNDPEVAALVSTGRTVGCFQIESPGMRATLKEIYANSIEDIIVALALYRPGPLTGGLKDAFVRRHNGQEDIQHIHPALAPMLDDTYGVILYQEQVLRIAHELAGLSLAESDLLRRAMSHFDPGRQMQLLREKFIRGAQENHSVDPVSAQRIWELMAAFAGYGFPKAHAASYALVAWQSAWCKTHYPAEFMAAVLANWGGFYSQRVYLMESRRLGVPVRAPHINHSQHEFCATYPQGSPVLYMGLNQVRGLTHRTIERILRHRPFDSLESFLTSVDPKREEARSLVTCGALDDLGSIPDMLNRLDQKTKPAGQLSLFEQPMQKDLPDWSPEARIRAQESILGTSVDHHPLEQCQAQIRKAGALNTVEASAHAGKHVIVAGVRQGSRRARDSKGRPMLFLSLEDLDGMLDVVLFADVYNRFRAETADNHPIFVEGIMEQDAPVLVAQRVYRIK